ncbi:hypothetical protein [Roseateles asaccharophilus]|uniref:DUF1579 domain-containing protein n=1 Tax=Roseateles asaccharophilus TaxID=582607 RepID=A0ABU2A273_9BURK|nr:hypothetical protein [Roseateles asaccharophilus]MDR7331298.1 hypothetical protein [Roseateles asaccharophilus]
MRHFLASLLLAAALQPAQASQPADLFDFWVGDWVVSWTTADGGTAQARNRVTKILDGQVIEENFEGATAVTPRLLGRSLSVRDKSGTWRQAWADNQGGFFALTGGADGEARFFATEFRQVGDKRQGQRMRFYDIRPDSFTWDWEGSADGGKTWTLMWRLHYRRAAP